MTPRRDGSGDLHVEGRGFCAVPVGLLLVAFWEEEQEEILGHSTDLNGAFRCVTDVSRFSPFLFHVRLIVTAALVNSCFPR